MSSRSSDVDGAIGSGNYADNSVSADNVASCILASVSLLTQSPRGPA